MAERRVAITVSNDLSYDQRMRKTANSLANNGYSPLLVGRVLKTSKKLREEAYAQHRLKLRFNKGKLFYLELNLRLFFFLLFKPLDILLAVDADTLLACTLISILRQKPLVYDSHELFTEVPELAGRSFSKAVWRSIESFGIKRASLCYTVGPLLAKELSMRYKKHFSTILNAPEYYALDNEQERQQFILYQGALNKGRGLEQLLKALMGLPYKLKIAGDGDLDEELRELSNRLGLEDQVEFLGYVPPDQLKELTRKAFLGYALLDDKSLSYRFSLANKFLDYIMAGVPSLISPMPEYVYINEKFSCCMEVELVQEDIRAKLRQAFDSKAEYGNMYQGCLRAREQYCWEIQEKKLLSLFNQL